MELTEKNTPAKTIHSGYEKITLPAGKRLQIRHNNPEITYILDETVPAGKSWDVAVTVHIDESDA